MPARHRPHRLSALLAALLLFITGAATAQAEEDWAARFERCYGASGLHVIETDAVDGEAASRINLHRLTIAWRELQARDAEAEFSVEALSAAGLLPALLPSPDDESYYIDPATNLVESTLGGARSQQSAVRLLLQNSQFVRGLLVRPTPYVRRQWKELYEGAQTPLFLKREIEFREYYLRHYHSPEIRNLLRLEGLLKVIDEAARSFCEETELADGEPLTLETLRSAGLLLNIQGVPKGARFVLTRAGERPSAVYKGDVITMGSSPATDLRRAAAEKQFAAYPDYPPAMAMSARFLAPPLALQRLADAIALWPDVPSLRVERLNHQANQGNFDAWPEDLDQLLDHFPSAPILYEIELASSTGAAALDPSIHQLIATALADRRPDLLHHQLSAIAASMRLGDLDTARRIHARLLRLNPAWGLLFPEPGAMRPPEPAPEGPEQEE